MPDIDQRLGQPESIPGRLAFIGMRRKTALRPSIEIPDLVCPVVPPVVLIGRATGKITAIESELATSVLNVGAESGGVTETVTTFTTEVV